MCIKVEHVKEEGGPLNHTEIQRTWCRPEEPSRLNVDIVFVLTNNINLMRCRPMDTAITCLYHFGNFLPLPIIYSDLLISQHF